MAGRTVGVALVTLSFAVWLDGLDRTPSRFTGGHFWSFVSTMQMAAVSGGLLIATSALLVRERRRPDWARGIAVVGIVAAVALAAKSADTMLVFGLGEDGLWGGLHVLVRTTPFALLLLLPWFTPRRPLGGPATWGLAGGVAVFLGGLALGIHAAHQSQIGTVSAFVNSGLSGMAAGLILVLTSSPLRVSRRVLVSVAVPAALAVVALGAAYVVDFGDRFNVENAEFAWFAILTMTGWISLALLIVTTIGLLRRDLVLPLVLVLMAAQIAYHLRFWIREDGVNELSLLYIIVFGFTTPMLAVLCAAITRGGEDGAEYQPRDSASASSLP